MRVPIAQRPKRVDSRHEFGHFESDTVIGTAPSKRCIDTQVERKSRRLFARFIEDKSALATARAEYDIYKDIPAPARIVFLVKSVFRVSSLIFFGFRHEECRPVVCFTGCPSCRT